MPFLFEPKELVIYACLSYCWGADLEGVLQTTRNNIPDHEKGIELSSLPKTIQDAITVCRGLKISNLWVDSICIIQDDSEDWKCEAAQMMSIYANSHVTICALEPSSCKVGFLGEQLYGKPEWQRKVKMNVPIEAGGPDDAIFIRQGRFTSRGRHSSQRREIKGLYDKDYDYDNIDTLHDEWRALVEKYSDRSLTKPTDKLVAIIGLANMMVSKLGVSVTDDYVAGLWRKTATNSKQSSDMVMSFYRRTKPVELAHLDDELSERWGAEHIISPSDAAGNLNFEGSVSLVRPKSLSGIFERLGSYRVLMDEPENLNLDQNDLEAQHWIRGMRSKDHVLKYPVPEDRDQGFYCFRLLTWAEDIRRRGARGSHRLAKGEKEVWYLVLQKRVPNSEHISKQKEPGTRGIFKRIGIDRSDPVGYFGLFQSEKREEIMII
ncbi:heterokaryon incompatibility protein-domain-containing protein [Biscogniauxia marginata]|nr:heterokaryon incompatibility protein-domain-containing protein [Biscogniauxia marginata]